LVAFEDEVFDEMRSDKAGTAGDEVLQISPRLR
jgi:hypothetical protein